MARAKGGTTESDHFAVLVLSMASVNVGRSRFAGDCLTVFILPDRNVSGTFGGR